MSTLKIDELKNNGSAIDLPNGIKVGGNEIVQGYTSSGTEPASPVTGDFWWDSTNELLYQYLNGEFKAIGLVQLGSGPTGPDPFSSFSVEATGDDSVFLYPFDNAYLVGSNDAASITDPQYWKRLQLTPTLTGTRRLIFRVQLPISGTQPDGNPSVTYNADVQIAGVIHRSGAFTTEYYFTNNRNHGFQSASEFTSGGASGSQPSNYVDILTTNNPGGGKFGLQVGGGPTGTPRTGRLRPPSPVSTGASVLSYMYSESSSPVNWSDTIWMRSPYISIAEGDIIEILAGEDAVSAQFLNVFVE